MTTTEYAQIILQAKQEASTTKPVDEAAALEAAQLISGEFTYLLYEALWTNFFEMDAITRHLERLYDSANYFGLIYFIVILADAVDYSIPPQFTEISANDAFVPFLSAAIIEDWLDYDANCEATEYTA